MSFHIPFRKLFPFFTLTEIKGLNFYCVFVLLLEEFMLASTNTELADDHSIFYFFAVSFRLPYGGSMETKILTVSLFQGFNPFD